MFAASLTAVRARMGAATPLVARGPCFATDETVSAGRYVQACLRKRRVRWRASSAHVVPRYRIPY